MTLDGRTAVVTGGSRGLGRAVVRHLANQGAAVVAVARNAADLDAVGQETGARTVAGDVRDAELARRVLSEAMPGILVLNAGVIGPMRRIDGLSWEEFSLTWQTDVKATLLWCQQAMRLPLHPGSHIFIVSSGAAVHGSILSGGYAGAKRMQWMLGNYFREECKRAGLDIRFTTVLPNLTGDTDLSRPAAAAYAERAGVTIDKFFENFGTRLTSDDFGRRFVELVDQPTAGQAHTVRISGDDIEVIEP